MEHDKKSAPESSRPDSGEKWDPASSIHLGEEPDTRGRAPISSEPGQDPGAKREAGGGIESTGNCDADGQKAEPEIDESESDGNLGMPEGK